MSKQVKKIVSTFHLGLVIVILAIVGTIILVTSGLFDTAVIANTNQHNHSNNNNASPSVNLNVVNEINKLEEVVKNNPTNHEVLLKLGHMLNDNGFYDKAIEKYDLFLKDHKDNVDVIVDMGVCYFELKQYEKSIDVIKSALAINPKHQIANFNLGIVNFANQNVVEAKKWWKKASDIDPSTNIGKKAEELLKSNN